LKRKGQGSEWDERQGKQRKTPTRKIPVDSLDVDKKDLFDYDN